MMSAVGFLLCAVAAVAIWRWLGTRREFLPIALFALVWFGAEAANLALDELVLAPLRADPTVPVPWTGWAHAAGLLASALWILPHAALVGVALVVFGGWSPTPALWAWVAAIGAVAILHPTAADGSLRLVHSVVEVLATVAATVALLIRYRKTRDTLSPPQTLLAIVLAVEAVTLVDHRVGSVPLHLIPLAAILLGGAIYLIRHEGYRAREALAQSDERIARLEKKLGEVTKDVGHVKEDVAEVVLHSRRTEEVTSRTGLLVKEMAKQAPSPALRKGPDLGSDEEPPSSRRGGPH